MWKAFSPKSGKLTIWGPLVCETLGPVQNSSCQIHTPESSTINASAILKIVRLK
jgi:hypothetical protein